MLKILEHPLQGLVVIFGLFTAPAIVAEPLAQLPHPQQTFTSPKLLTVKDAVFLALRSNPDIRNAELQRVVDKFALEVARNQFEPQYSLMTTANYGTGTSAAYAATPQVSITTPLGTQFTVSDQTNYGGGSGINSVGTVSVTQPLLRGFGRAVTEASLYDAVQNEKNNKLALKQEVITVIVNVVSDYYKLVQDYNNLQTGLLSLQNSQITLNQTRLKVEAGKMPRTNVVEQESSVAQQQVSLEQTRNQIQQDYQQLLTILGLDPASKLEIVKAIKIDTSPLPTLEESIRLALANNIDYQKALNSFEVTKRQLVVAEDQRKWQLNVTASASRPLTSNDGGGGTPFVNVNGSPGTTVTGPGTTKTLQFNLTIPINDISSKQQLVSARIALDQAKVSLAQQKRALIAMVTSVYQSLLSLQEQIKLSENSVQLAQQSLEIERLKYNYGKATNLDITTAQSSLTTQQINFIGQQISYLNAVQSFYQTLGITLEKWNLALSY